MGIKDIFNKTAFASHVRAIRTTPREIIFNRHLLLSALIYAMGAIPATWDQGSASVVSTLPGFEHHFHISSGTNAGDIKNFVSIVYIGYAWGAALSFFTNDRLGRLWSYRVYTCIYIVGQLVATFTPTLAGLYASRIISGWGIGALTVTSPLSIVEIAPREIRGLLAAWFTVAMGLALVCSTFCVYGVFAHIPASKLQYQVVFFSPCIWMTICMCVSFFTAESPRWLFLAGRREEAISTVTKLRGLPTNHPRVQTELEDMESSTNGHQNIVRELGFIGIVKDTFFVRSNFRRVQQTIMAYALAQLSGANSITSYYVPILTLLGVGGGTLRNLFLTGMYGMSKFFFSIIASFFLIDTLGRRKSLFIGCTLQMISDLYLGIFLRFKQSAESNTAASQGAIAFIFIHAFGYGIGLFTLPYVFGSEVWPDHLRSFGTALSAMFHWLFIYAMLYGTPSLLANTHNWGAFIFYASWCALAIIYVYVTVPETRGLSVAEIEKVFEGPWFNAYKRSKKLLILEGPMNDDLATEDHEVNHPPKLEA